MTSLFGNSGIVNQIFSKVGLPQIAVLTNANAFRGFIWGSNIWKEIGWDSIIYIAAITSIDPGLYEAAEVDGASRLQKNWHITLPDIFMGAARTTSSFAKWANEGLLKEIPQDLSAYPALSAYLNNPELSTCQIGGKTYCIFRKSYQEQAATSIDRPIVSRWDLAQKAGVEKEPETWEEFHDMIQKIIAADPEGKNIQGMTAKGPRLLAGVFVPYTMKLGAVSGVTFYWTQKEDGSYVPAYFGGDTLGADALPIWEMVRTFYEDGTIEKDIAVNTSAQAGEKFLQGANAAIIYDGGTANIYNDVGRYWTDVYGVDFVESCRYLNLMDDINDKKTYPVWDYAWSTCKLRET